MRRLQILTLFVAVSMAPHVTALEINKSQVVAAAKVLAGGEIGQPPGTNQLGRLVASRLKARGLFADLKCGMNGQQALADWVNWMLGVEFHKDDEDDKKVVSIALLFAADDFMQLGKKEWCTDYVMRATPASALFSSFMPTGKKGKRK